MKWISKNVVLYWIERMFPYVISFCIVLALCSSGTNFAGDKNYNNALNGILTMIGLIIGFLGAVMPVIMGMKNESKFVIYVFQKDQNKLFLKYIKSTIGVGIITAFVTIFMYFKESFSEGAKYYSFYGWIFLVLLFLLLTYRSIKYMIELIFSDDNEIIKGKTIRTNPSKNQRDVMQKINKKI